MKTEHDNEMLKQVSALKPKPSFIGLMLKAIVACVFIGLSYVAAVILITCLTWFSVLIGTAAARMLFTWFWFPA